MSTLDAYRVTYSLLYQPLYDRCMDGTASPRERIKAFCLICLGCDRSAISDCTDRGCPLWPQRPYRPGAADDES